MTNQSVLFLIGRYLIILVGIQFFFSGCAELDGVFPKFKPKKPTNNTTSTPRTGNNSVQQENSSEENHLMNEILLHCENITKEIGALTEITKNYKSLLSSIENYSGAKNNNDFPLCIKKLSDIESSTIKITDYFKKLTKSEYVQLEKLKK